MRRIVKPGAQWLIPLILLLAACASEPIVTEPEIVRETVEVPVTVEVTREVVEVEDEEMRS